MMLPDIALESPASAAYNAHVAVMIAGRDPDLCCTYSRLSHLQGSIKFPPRRQLVVKPSSFFRPPDAADGGDAVAPFDLITRAGGEMRRAFFWNDESVIALFASVAPEY